MVDHNIYWYHGDKYDNCEGMGVGIAWGGVDPWKGIFTLGTVGESTHISPQTMKELVMLLTESAGGVKPFT